MNNSPESPDDYENGDDAEYDVYEELEEHESDEDIEPPRPLLTEIISVWISAVSLAIKPKAITFEEEIEFASWRRFWVTLVSGTLLNIVVQTLTTKFIWEQLGLPRQSPGAFDLLWAGLVGLIVSSFLVWIGCYSSYRWIRRQKIDTESDFLEHSQIIVIIWLGKQILLAIWSLIGTTFAVSLSGQVTAAQISQGSTDLSIIAGFVISFLVSGSIIIYSYWILAQGMKVNHAGLQGKQLWIVIGILFLALDPLRILVSSALPKIPLVVWLHHELQNRFVGQS
jgi:hypothetical protein